MSNAKQSTPNRIYVNFSLVSSTEQNLDYRCGEWLGVQDIVARFDYPSVTPVYKRLERNRGTIPSKRHHRSCLYFITDENSHLLERKKQEIKLNVDYQQRDQVVIDNLGLVGKYVRNFLRRFRLNTQRRIRDDLKQEVGLAIIDAALRYDPSRGVSFEIFAKKAIYGAMFHILRTTFPYNRTSANLKSRLEKSENFLRMSLMRNPTQEELSQSQGMTLDELNAARTRIEVQRNMSGECLPFSVEKVQGNISRETEAFDPHIKTQRQELCSLLRRAILKLDPIKRSIIINYYYRDMNMVQIGEIQGISARDVSELRTKSLEELAIILSEQGVA